MKIVEGVANLYEEFVKYTRTTGESASALILFHVFIRHCLETRRGLVLDRNFDLYMSIARHLENPYCLLERSELADFLEAVDEAAEKEDLEPLSIFDKDMNLREDVPLTYLFDRTENENFRRILKARSFRDAYSSFISLDFSSRRALEDILYTVSWLSRKDCPREKGYSIGKLVSRLVGLSDGDAVIVRSSCTAMPAASLALFSSIAIKDTGNVGLAARMTRMMTDSSSAAFGPDTKVKLTITDGIPENVDKVLASTENLIAFVPSNLLLSSVKEIAEKRLYLIDRLFIRRVIVLPPLSAEEDRSLVMLQLRENGNEYVTFCDLKKDEKDKEMFLDNQMTEKAIEIASFDDADGLRTAKATYDEIAKSNLLVPGNYMDAKGRDDEDTEDLMARIEEKYVMLQSLAEQGARKQDELIPDCR